jgi:hypothetical protein
MQKVSKTPSQQNKLGVMIHVWNLSYAGGMDRRISVLGPIQKITKAKKG